MNCEGVSDLLPDWVSGRLTPEESAEVRGHLVECTECRDEVEVVRLLAESPAEGPPAGLEVRVREAARMAAREWEDATPSDDRVRHIGLAPPVRRPMPTWALGIAAAAVLALGTPLLMNRMPAVPDNGTNGMPEMEAMLIEEPVATVWASEDGLIAGAPMIETLTDEELALLLEEMEG